ncbi:superoxide dismutase [Chytriomyces sp. MP71]|nr:superoxide dismutase [Chytriomyces sp. MP71]
MLKKNTAVTDQGQTPLLNKPSGFNLIESPQKQDRASSQQNLNHNSMLFANVLTAVVATVATLTLAAPARHGFKAHPAAGSGHSQPARKNSKPLKALAKINPTEGQSIQGSLALSQDAPGGPVTLTVKLTGGAPGSSHGFHLHGFGDTSDPKGLNAFGHFNPTNVSHDPTQKGVISLKIGTHLGDLGSVVFDASGAASQTWVSKELDLSDAARAGFALGRGVIVHNATDDCVTQPTGNSGSRLAQGVVAYAQGAGIYPTKGVQAGSKVDAIAVFKGDVKGTVVVVRRNATDPLVFKYNVTGLPASRTLHLGITGFNQDKSSTKQNCKDAQVVTLKSDATGSAIGEDKEAGKKIPGISALLGQYAILVDNDCEGKSYIAYAPIGARNATLDAIAVTPA